jgi:DNA-binding HxlR family transcriptional regulator
MPKTPWTGYGRFCPLARALDVVGDRWTLVIVQELLKRSSRYSDLVRRLPGASTSLVTERLRKLEVAGVVERQPGPVGAGVVYALTDRGRALAEPLTALRRWGVTYLTDPGADGTGCQRFDVRYVEGIELLEDEEFGLVIDDTPSTLRFEQGTLLHAEGAPGQPTLVVTTSTEFMDRWAAGEAGWDDGVSTGEVRLSGDAAAWPRWLAATGYLLRYQPEHAGP